MTTDYLCPQCGRVGQPDLDRTMMDDRYAPGTCPHGGHSNRHLTLVRRDIYDASLVSRHGKVIKVRQPHPKQETLLDE